MYTVGTVQKDRFKFTMSLEAIAEVKNDVKGGFYIEQRTGYTPVIYFSDKLATADEFVKYLDLNKLTEDQLGQMLEIMKKDGVLNSIHVYFDEFNQNVRLSYFD